MSSKPPKSKPHTTQNHHTITKQRTQHKPEFKHFGIINNKHECCQLHPTRMPPTLQALYNNDDNNGNSITSNNHNRQKRIVHSQTPSIPKCSMFVHRFPVFLFAGGAKEHGCLVIRRSTSGHCFARAHTQQRGSGSGVPNGVSSGERYIGTSQSI